MAKAAAPGVIITIVTLGFIDAVCIIGDILPPRFKKGHPTLGFYENQDIPGGSHRVCPVPELANDEVAKHYWKNEDGFQTVRSMADFAHHPTGRRVIALGDSHTELVYAHPLTHFGVLERRLREGGWVGAEVLGAGHGRWSPMQSTTLYEEKLSRIRPEVVVLNLYLGNDFYDLIRSDDRPHLVPAPGGGYTLGAPQWVAYADPTSDPFWRKSRVLFLGKMALDKIGVEDAYEKFIYAKSSAEQFGVSFFDSLGYINDLRQTKDDALWYDAAFGAQVLNQALFFKHFPGSLEESQRRARYVLEQTKAHLRASGDEALLVLSPIPSRVLAKPDLKDDAYDRVMARMPVTPAEVVAMEMSCYESIRRAAEETGWLFVDTLPGLRAGPDDVYFASDLHIAPSGSEIVGTAQSQVILKALPAPAAP